MDRQSSEKRMRERTPADRRRIESLVNCDRRRFLTVTGSFTAMAAAAGITAAHSFQPLRWLGGDDEFRIAYLSDTHLFARGRTHRSAQAMLRAVYDLNALDPQPDFVVFGGDLARTGHPSELSLGREILSELRAPLRMVIGEADYYLDLGEKWRELFGPDRYSFDHKGVHFVALNSVDQADFWTRSRLSPDERSRIAIGLDDVRRSPFRVGPEGLGWLADDLSGLERRTPIVLLSHSPLYKLYRPWNFWTDDADDVQRLVSRFDSVTVLHGHTHQLLVHRVRNVSFFGMLSTAMAWPYAPEGLPDLTLRTIGPRSAPEFQSGGQGLLALTRKGPARKTYLGRDDVRHSFDGCGRSHGALRA